MPLRFPRRAVLLGAACLPFAAAATPTVESIKAAGQRLAALEQKNGGRLGVAVVNMATEARLMHRADERFPLCSTFKLLAAAAILKKVDDGRATLDQFIKYEKADLLDYAPETRKHVGEGRMRLGELCAAAIELSDNTAANLLLREIGGPPGLTRYVRGLGDEITRLDRTEPTLNTAIPGDPRDTSTPRAMAHTMTALLLKGALTPASTRQLEAWLVADKVSGARLRAGLPPGWRIGDKTGTGDNGTANTIAILWPPQRAPLIATVYYTGSLAPPATRNAVHAEVARVIAQTF
jgi:beta-lactamase class A